MLWNHFWCLSFSHTPTSKVASCVRALLSGKYKWPLLLSPWSRPPSSSAWIISRVSTHLSVFTFVLTVYSLWSSHEVLSEIQVRSHYSSGQKLPLVFHIPQDKIQRSNRAFWVPLRSSPLLPLWFRCLPLRPSLTVLHHFGFLAIF